ncbi:MAG: Hsp20/alpha crystallin family protein [Limnohabitans sp.]|jgi:HSP20 family protein|nr:Hsp20/alpha crystallin family protein [Limnohabitans sp.]
MNLSLWNRNPIVDEFARARDDMDRMLGRFVGGMPTTFGGNLGNFALGARLEGWVPPVDVGETDDEVTVRAEIPGIAPRDLEITVAGNILNIAGQKSEKEETEREDFYRCERRFGSFRRVIELPDSIDPDRVAADVDQGVVTIRIAKKPGERTRRVEIKPATRRVTVPS